MPDGIAIGCINGHEQREGKTHAKVANIILDFVRGWAVKEEDEEGRCYGCGLGDRASSETIEILMPRDSFDPHTLFFLKSSQLDDVYEEWLLPEDSRKERSHASWLRDGSPINGITMFCRHKSGYGCSRRVTMLFRFFEPDNASEIADELNMDAYEAKCVPQKLVPAKETRKIVLFLSKHMFGQYPVIVNASTRKPYEFSIYYINWYTF